MTPALITLTDAAAQLGCNPETLRRHCADGQIPGAFKLGGWRLPANIVEIMQTVRGPALRMTEEPCQSASGEKAGGSTSPRRTEAELDALLERLTVPPRKNSTIA